MLSPGLAKAWELLALVETRVMPLRVGGVVSRTTWVLSSVAVTGEPLLPARSSTSMLKEALPFCLAKTVPLTSQCLPSVSILVNSRVSRPVTLISALVGVWIGSVVLKLRVT